ncbi:MAG: type II toxin-antitoxin system RelE/ParE family toxin [Pyrinomonadaceae bacterium]
MKHSVEISPRARKDLRKIDAETSDRILLRIAALNDDLAGDVKRLTDFEPEYRLRVGNYRILFDLEDNKVVVRRVKHRREAY